MAESPAHRFGQIIGEVLEIAIQPRLKKFAKTHRLYFDKKGSRPCRPGLKCTWKDHNGNKHDLDFVLEKGGSPNKLGMPVAFIETAWRRYTKHSRNKAQEIQGAIEPLAETYKRVRPFKGAVLAGEFTSGALAQLKSLGFAVLYVPYATIVSVFGKFGIDASSEEDTAEAEFKRKIKGYKNLSDGQRKALAAAMIAACRRDATQFFSALETTVVRQIERITVIPLHGRPYDLATISEAIEFVQKYKEDNAAKMPVLRYEVQIGYSNGDLIDGKFRDREGAIEFLREYQASAS